MEGGVAALKNTNKTPVAFGVKWRTKSGFQESAVQGGPCCQESTVGICRPAMEWASSKPMKYRRFGRTGIQMPVFSCGGMRYQQSWSDIPWDQVPAAGQANLDCW
jgi:hypothetical protein